MNRSYPSRPKTLGDLAAALGLPASGNPDLPIGALVHPREARGPTDLVFVMDAALLPFLATTPVRVAVVAEGIDIAEGALDGWVTVARPRYALAALLDLFGEPVHAPPGVHPSAVVDPSATLGADVSIGAMAYVGPRAAIGPRTIVMPQATVGAGARIGADCLLHPGVRIGERVILGDRVIAHHNASVGADGFSFVTPETASYESARGIGKDLVETPIRDLRRINSIGTVIVGDDVEIGASAAIDRANIGATTIGRGTKIDNLVQIGHNCVIGEDCLFSGHVGISGSSRIGDRVVMAGQAGIADHMRIGDDAIIGPQAGVGRDVPERLIVMGTPAIPKSAFFKERLGIGRLGRFLRDLADLRARVAKLEDER